MGHWKSHETAMMLAVDRYIERFLIPRIGARMVRHRADGRVHLVPDIAPCDIVGCVRGSGRAFIADAKSCLERLRFPYAKIVPHQYDEIVRCGDAGAIAGVLVEACHAEVGLVFWIDWTVLRGDRNKASIEWTDERLICLGDNRSIPDLKIIIEDSNEKQRADRPVGDGDGEGAGRVSANPEGQGSGLH